MLLTFLRLAPPQQSSSLATVVRSKALALFRCVLWRVPDRWSALPGSGSLFVLTYIGSNLPASAHLCLLLSTPALPASLAACPGGYVRGPRKVQRPPAQLFQPVARCAVQPSRTPFPLTEGPAGAHRFARFHSPLSPLPLTFLPVATHLDWPKPAWRLVVRPGVR